jgi:predicted negative regulator of RcsB-dependent stress response
MSTHQIDEYELGERVRTWFKDNSGSLITGVAIGLGCIFAYQWWQGNGAKHSDEAAMQYQAFNEAAEKSDPTKTNIILALLESKYSDTPYLNFAVLRQAELLQVSGKNDDAMKLLESHAGKVEEPAIKELYQLRIARLYLINGKPDLALKQLADVKDSTYPASLEEIRGDAQMALGKRELASKSYVKALTALDEAAPIRNLVELKLIDAGGSVPAKPGA